jgi:hypothetical protein
MMFQEMASASRSEIYNNFDSYEDQLKLSHQAWQVYLENWMGMGLYFDKESSS